MPSIDGRRSRASTWRSSRTGAPSRPNVGQLKLSELENAYGIGFRFNTYKSVWFRIDIGFGGEGVQTFFKFSKAF